MSARSFRRASCHVLDKTEIADFTHKIFNLFDADGDAYLTFEEFTMAVETKDTKGNPLGKLAWLFDTVYDKVSKNFNHKQEV
jgi:Ca2+-binding EF-hand superfamily protein